VADLRPRCSTCPITQPICAGQSKPSLCSVGNMIAYEDDGITAAITITPASFLDLRNRISNFLSFGPASAAGGVSLYEPGGIHDPPLAPGYTFPPTPPTAPTAPPPTSPVLPDLIAIPSLPTTPGDLMTENPKPQPTPIAGPAPGPFPGPFPGPYPNPLPPGVPGPSGIPPL